MGPISAPTTPRISPPPPPRNSSRTYEAKYGKKPDDVAALTYDAGKLLLRRRHPGRRPWTARRCGTPWPQVKEFDGVTGQMKFHGTGDPIKSAVIIQIKGWQVPVLLHGGPVKAVANTAVNITRGQGHREALVDWLTILCEPLCHSVYSVVNRTCFS